MDIEYQDIEVDRIGTGERVARITLNKPEVLNAISQRMMDEFDAALRALEADQSVRVILIRGAGRAFCAGWDLGGSEVKYQRHDVQGRPYVINQGTWIRAGAEVQLKLWEVAKVTIVQAHGHCIAGGMELAMMADLVTTSTDCTFGHPGHRGIGVGRNGMILPLIIGMRKAKELMYTGDSFNGEEAEQLGLVNYAWPKEELEERTLALANRVANLSGDFLGAVKQAANTFYENMGLRSSVQQISYIDAMAQFTESGYNWREDVQKLGIKDAVRARDEPYGDYGARRRRSSE